MLNGIDISNYQPGIELSRVPCDFVIVQHSFGNYVQSTFSSQANRTLRFGKKLGIYHYVTGQAGEIDTFINGVRGYVGRAVLALDFEATDNARWGDFGYLQDFAQRIISELGTHPLLYGSASIYDPLINISHNLNCGLWIAQYASEAQTGYQAQPWNEQAYNMAIFQYSSNGRLYGYNGSLDLDMFYGTDEDWNLYAHSTNTAPTHIAKETSMELSTTFVNQNKNTLPIGRKIAIKNIGGSLYLNSHDGILIMDADPMPFYVQENSDRSISLADPWGNWITVSSSPANGDIPTVVRGNGSIEQRWVASPFQGGFKLTSLVNGQMNLDLPNDNDKNGQKVQIWGEWPNPDEKCPNQTWIATLYSDVEPKPIAHTAVKVEAKTIDKPTVEPKTDAKPVAKPITEDKPIEHTVDKAIDKPVAKTESDPKIADKPIVEEKPAETKAKVVDKTMDKPVEPTAKTEIEHTVEPKSIKPIAKKGKPMDDKDVIEKVKGLVENASDEDMDKVADDTAAVVEQILGKRKLNRQAIRWVMVIGSLIALASTVIIILGTCGVLPKWSEAIPGLVTAFYATFAHALGISATTK